MLTADLDFNLPDDLIAQHPADQRDESKIMILHRDTKQIAIDVFRNVPNYLDEGDCLVLNDTKVIHARLKGKKPTGGQVEIFLLRERSPGEWAALVRPSAKVKPGTAVTINKDVTVTIHETVEGAARRVVFDRPDVLALLEESGAVPLPPYIRRDKADPTDRTRYQTVYAQRPGAVAAPTAGLHYTDAVFRALEDRGCRRAHITLHVGYGTFRPITADRVDEHVLEAEEFHVPEETAHILNETRAAGGRIVAVGTTSTRVLESQYQDGRFHHGTGSTAHYICPPYTFQAVDVLQTNFHLPRSSLLALVYAFAGRDLVQSAYRHAIEERLRFYSYGDAMLIL
jgi:S-adenosylmethionine:tRNA ribosyltransferase-isomerase